MIYHYIILLILNKTVEVLRSSEKVLRNFVVPMTQQPIVGLLSSKQDPFQYVYDLYDSSKRNFAVGAFYVSTLQSRSDGNPEISKKPGLFFSYNFHTDHKTLIKYQDDSNTEQSFNQYRLIKFADISTAVQEPNRYYRIGFSVIRRVENINDTSKSASSYSYQCSFNTTTYDVYIGMFQLPITLIFNRFLNIELVQYHLRSGLQIFILRSPCFCWIATCDSLHHYSLNSIIVLRQQICNHKT